MARAPRAKALENTSGPRRAATTRTKVEHLPLAEPSSGNEVLVTGGTGFIGRYLIERLLQRPDLIVHVLVRGGSEDKFEALRTRFPDAGNRLRSITGDITDIGLMSAADAERIGARLSQVYHLAAAYDMEMDEHFASRVNVDGTQNVVDFCNLLQGRVTLHHVSSVAVAGAEWSGTFSESMFDEGQVLEHPYYRTKFAAEALVRRNCQGPFRIFRPGIVVGDSRTGEMDKIDGPYYFFKAIQKISHRLPKWAPLLGIDGGRLPICPVDYVAAAIDEISNQPGLDGQCFHLLQSPPPRVGRVLSIFLEAAHGPEFALKLHLPAIPHTLRKFGRQVPEAIQRKLAKTIGVPLSVLGYAFNQAVFDNKNTRHALRGTGIRCPDLREYADKLWAYWEMYLDLTIHVPPKLHHRIAGKVVLVTGASSGIGFAAAKKLAAAGAKVLLVARTVEKLEECKAIIEKIGGQAYVYPCDLTDMDDIDRLAKQVLHDFDHVDILVNNAGRSIRRSVFESFRRFHDFERTMQLNYFGPVRLIMKLLPSMAKRKSGHIINISSIGVLANAARFSAYVASKAALDAYTRCLSAEVRASKIHTTAIYMPLVRTPMIAPTKVYDYVPTWSPDDAADTVIRAIVERPKSIATSLGTMASISYALWPKVNDYILSMGFNLFPSSSSAIRGRRDGHKPTLEQVVFANVFKGEHW